MTNSNDLLKPAITLLVISILLIASSILFDGIILLPLYPEFSLIITLLTLVKTSYIILATAIVSAYFDRNTNKEVKP